MFAAVLSGSCLHSFRGHTSLRKTKLRSVAAQSPFYSVLNVPIVFQRFLCEARAAPSVQAARARRVNNSGFHSARLRRAYLHTCQKSERKHFPPSPGLPADTGTGGADAGMSGAESHVP